MEVDLDVSPAERLLQLPGTFSWAAPTRPPVKAILPGRKLVNLNLASVLILRCRLVGANPGIRGSGIWPAERRQGSALFWISEGV
jgi:hypothetical protein